MQTVNTRLCHCHCQWTRDPVTVTDSTGDTVTVSEHETVTVSAGDTVTDSTGHTVTVSEHETVTVSAGDTVTVSEQETLSLTAQETLSLSVNTRLCHCQHRRHCHCQWTQDSVTVTVGTGGAGVCSSSNQHRSALLQLYCICDADMVLGWPTSSKWHWPCLTVDSGLHTANPRSVLWPATAVLQ